MCGVSRNSFHHRLQKKLKESCAFFPDWDGSEPNLISTVDNYNPGNSASENVKTQVITGQTLPY
jgi:hypothetical protein